MKEITHTFVATVLGEQYIVDYTCTGNSLKVLYVTHNTEDVTWSLDSGIWAEIEEQARDHNDDHILTKAEAQNDEL